MKIKKCEPICFIIAICVIVILVLIVRYFMNRKYLRKLTSAGLFDIEKENYQSILFGPISGGWCETGKCNRMGRCPKSGIPCATVDSLENRALGLTCKDFHCP